jgi:hypothetical protein
MYSLTSFVIRVTRHTRAHTGVQGAAGRMTRAGKGQDGPTTGNQAAGRGVAFSESPTYLRRSSGPLTARKLSALSVASALASSVLEQPGGPYSSTPADGRIPSRANCPAQGQAEREAPAARAAPRGAGGATTRRGVGAAGREGRLVGVLERPFDRFRQRGLGLGLRARRVQLVRGEGRDVSS